MVKKKKSKQSNHVSFYFWSFLGMIVCNVIITLIVRVSGC